MEVKNLEELNIEIRQNSEEFYKRLSQEDYKIKVILLDENKKVLSEIKDYIKILAGIIATIIPFSSLIFIIDKDILSPNIFIWAISLIFFILAFFVLLFSYFKYVDKLFHRMVQHILNYDPLDLISYELNKDDDKKIIENSNSLISHYKKSTELKNEFNNGLFENKLITILLPKIKVSLYLLLFGFIFLFISIFYENIIKILDILIMCIKS